MRRAEATLAGSLLLAYLALGVLFAVRTPAWQAPDEPAHYNYVRQLVEGTLPVIQPGDWDQTYLSQVVGAEFDPAYPVTGITYEDWQPPLYYLLQAPIYALSGGSLTAMRLLSVALGAGVVALAYAVGKAVLGRVAPALAVAAFVAFLPQHLAILASVNNDALSELIIAAVLAVLVAPWPERPPPRRLLGLGLLLGAGFLTKGQAYLMAPVAGVFLLARYWKAEEDASSHPALQGAGAWRPLARVLVLVFVPALLVGLLWWGRNAVVYGDFDVLARQTHDQVVVGRFARTTFVSFWGQFGWMAAPLPGWMIGPLLLLTVAAAGGLLLAAVGRRTTDDSQKETRGLWSVVRRPRFLHILILTLTFLLTLALHVVYNLTFVQHQGRYLYPALIPIAVGFVVGLGFWLQPLVRRWSWAEWLLPLGLAALLGSIALFAVWRILPGMAPG